MWYGCSESNSFWNILKQLNQVFVSDINYITSYTLYSTSHQRFFFKPFEQADRYNTA